MNESCIITIQKVKIKRKIIYLSFMTYNDIKYPVGTYLKQSEAIEQAELLFTIIIDNNLKSLSKESY